MDLSSMDVPGNLPRVLQLEKRHRGQGHDRERQGLERKKLSALSTKHDRAASGFLRYRLPLEEMNAAMASTAFRYRAREMGSSMRCVAGLPRFSHRDTDTYGPVRSAVHHTPHRRRARVLRSTQEDPSAQETTPNTWDLTLDSCAINRSLEETDVSVT